MNLRREDLTQIRLSNRQDGLSLSQGRGHGVGFWSWLMRVMVLQVKAWVQVGLGFSPLGETGEGFVFDLTPSPSPKRRGHDVGFCSWLMRVVVFQPEHERQCSAVFWTHFSIGTSAFVASP